MSSSRSAPAASSSSYASPSISLERGIHTTFIFTSFYCMLFHELVKNSIGASLCLLIAVIS
jgi:hypothetical protein